MSESMIERVARALALADLDDETREVVDLDAHMAHVRGHYEELARAAIEAMHEPTKPMVEAGAVSCGEDSEATAIGAWEGMIDAALNEHANAR